MLDSNQTFWKSTGDISDFFTLYNKYFYNLAKIVAFAIFITNLFELIEKNYNVGYQNLGFIYIFEVWFNIFTFIAFIKLVFKNVFLPVLLMGKVLYRICRRNTEILRFPENINKWADRSTTLKSKSEGPVSIFEIFNQIQ